MLPRPLSESIPPTPAEEPPVQLPAVRWSLGQCTSVIGACARAAGYLRDGRGDLARALAEWMDGGAHGPAPDAGPGGGYGRA